MNAVKYGWKSFSRRGKSSFLFAALIFQVVAALTLSVIVVEVCGIYKARNENPYGDYYRLLVDRRNPVFNAGHQSMDKMYAGWWPRLQKIHQYFLDITDYTAEVYGQAETSLQPYLPSWCDDQGYFLLYGVTDCMEVSAFAKGELTLTEGRLLTERDRREDTRVCLLSKDIASANRVSIGDAIEIEMKDETMEEYTVVGIYEDHVRRSNLNVTLSYDLPENRIFVPLSTFDRAYSSGCYNYQIKLSDDALIGEVEALVNKYGMCEGYPAYFIKVSDLYGTNNRGVRSLEKAFTIVRWVFMTVATLLIVVYVRSAAVSRRKEYGVLLATGHSKGFLAVGFFAELFCCIAAGGLPSVGLLMLLGKPAATALLTATAGNVSAEALAVTTSDTVGGMLLEAEAFDTAIGGGFIGACMGNALGIFLPVAVLSVIVSLWSILRAKPMQLLSRQEGI